MYLMFPLLGLRRNIATPFGTEKLERCATYGEKKFDDTFSYFDGKPACDGQMDGQTVILRR